MTGPDEWVAPLAVALLVLVASILEIVTLILVVCGRVMVGV